MLSKKLHEAMNAQINAELWSAYLYLSMSMDAEAKVPETGNRRIALFIQIIDFQADIKFDLAGILLPYPAKLL